MTLRRGVRLVLLTIALLFVLLPMAGLYLLWSGWVDGFLREAVIEQAGRMTGGRVDLGQFHFDPWNLRVTVRDLTVHGREQPNMPPFFHAEAVTLDLSVDSWMRRSVSLAGLELTRPAIFIRFAPDGSSNAPAPPPRAASGSPLRQRLFSFVVRRFRLVEGELTVNDTRVPLSVQGGLLNLDVDYGEPAGIPTYMGDLVWQKFEITARRYVPAPSDISIRFEFRPDSFSVTQLVWDLPHTSVDAQFGVASFARPSWDFRYRGRLDLQDIRTILRKPNTPDGRVEFSGEGNFAHGDLALTGRYSAEDIRLGYRWFHTAGISSRATYSADRRSLFIPDFAARALGGSVTGEVRLAFSGLAFVAQTRVQGVNLSELLAAADNPRFPLQPLHWAATVDADNVTTWRADFKNVDSRGTAFWAPPLELQPGEIPATARLNYHYSMATSTVSLTDSEISTPYSRIQMSGVLGRTDSAIETLFETDNLTSWNDFVNRLRGLRAEPKEIAGRLRWQGRMNGPLGGPVFSGRAQGWEVRYDRLYWDEVEGDVVFSPTTLRFERARARRDVASAQFDISLDLTNWRFVADSPWSFEATLVRTDSDGLQAVLGWSYPARGLISGSFRGGGTRAEPFVEGLFDIMDPQAWGWQFDRARGELNLDRNQVRISNAELRFLPPAPSEERLSVPGLLTGNFLYRIGEGSVALDVTGAAVPLESIPAIQWPRLPVRGQASFQLAGDGPLGAPRIHGALRLVDLHVGDELLGSFQSSIESDGRMLALRIDSEIAAGEVHAQAEVMLADEYPVTGRINLQQVDLDPFIISALRLNQMEGHSSVDGDISISGPLRRPESLTVNANLSRLVFTSEYVNVQNTGPLRLAYHAGDLRIESASLRGLDTDLQISGSARFIGDRMLNLRLVGGANLSLLSAFSRSLDARGPARVDAEVSGTFDDPRLNGRVRLENTSVRYGDFPTGLSQVTGDLVFDANRIVFDNLSAESGGGQLILGGAVTYRGGPVRYDLTLRTDRVRVRYPIGMSWLAGGTLRLSGDRNAGTLSGRVTVERLLMSEGFDLGSLVASSMETVSAPSTTNPFLRNLQFDIQADLAPNARFEWSTARFQSEASMRVRGTWEHPILLGHIHLLGGEMEFRGNRYQISRGDINFANPFRLDPVISIEATTTIRQYEVTVNFSGSASHLTMSYRSDPPLPSNDVITLLALGETGEETRLRGLPAGQSAGAGATTLLSEAISSQLGGRIQRLFGISHFSVDPLFDTGTGQEPSARVTISQQLTQNLIVTYVTSVTSTQQQIIQIEYAVRRDISLIALRDENGTFGVDVIFKKRFK
jgi:translocation and assembly module TamB